MTIDHEKALIAICQHVDKAMKEDGGRMFMEGAASKAGMKRTTISEWWKKRRHELDVESRAKK